MTIMKTTTRKKNRAAVAPEGPQASTSAEIATPTLPGSESATDTSDHGDANANLSDAASATSLLRAGQTALPAKTARPGTPAMTKAGIILKKLRAAKGASIDMLVEATGWQAHSVRGFLSATVKKKLGLTVESDVGKDGVRRYRIVDQAA